ncbi:MAG: ABC transporter permease [Thaumarchaeota archaeon]|nr:ABC transporter permease [Nitrososphaerota archaeon]
MLVAGIVLTLLGFNALEGYSTIWVSSFGSLIAFGVFISKFVPLVLLALAFALPMQTKKYNVGNEGQFLSGAVGATIFAFSFPSLPPVVAIPLLIIAGALFGAAWSVIPALLLYKFNVNVVLSTIAMNFIAYQMVPLVALGPWHDTLSGQPSTLPIPAPYQIPAITTSVGDSLGVALALVMPLAAYFLVYKTVKGYEIRATGDNPQAAFAFGISTRFLGPLSLLVAGGIAGLAGGIQLAGYQFRLIDGMQLNYGVLSQMIALIAMGNPIGVLFTTILITIIEVGSNAMQRTMGVPAPLVLVIEAMILLLVLIANVVRRRSK